MKIIGLSGYARSGKDAAADVLVKEAGYVRVAFADKLREMVYALNPIVQQRFHMTASLEEDSRVVYVQDVIDAYGWDGYKETVFGPEIRRLLQRMGTEAGRETLWDSIWIDAALTGLPEDAKVVVTDVRFPNEAQAIIERGGTLLRIERAGVGPATAEDGTVHKSETSLDDWPFVYRAKNDGTLEDWEELILRFPDAWDTDQYFEKVIGI